MAGFKTLKDISAHFDEEMRRLSRGLFCAKIGETAEDVMAKKLRDISLFTSKYRLLHAKEAALTPQIAERVENGAEVISDYEQVAQSRVLEAAVVKSIQQSRAVQALLTTDDRKLDADMIVRKEKIKTKLARLRTEEQTLHQADRLLMERQEEFVNVRARWDEVLGEMRDRRAEPQREIENEGPMYQKLRIIVNKMEVMRSLLGRLVTSRGGAHDWLNDRRPLTALKLTRLHSTVESFTAD